MFKKNEVPGYKITVGKNLDGIGEIISIETALPQDATEAELLERVRRITEALDFRVNTVNRKVNETRDELKAKGEKVGKDPFDVLNITH